MNRYAAILLFFMITTGFFSVIAQTNAGTFGTEGSQTAEILEQGLGAFQNSDFSRAMGLFREVLLEEPDPETEANAYFWISKSAMALGRLDDAERNLEYYLRNFPGHDFVVEARYQRGRLLYMQNDFQAAIQALNGYIEQYPGSPFVANATYWSGESLYQLGRLDEARIVFQTVLQRYPQSFRVEAARYRISLIELNTRETELLQLLRWSHEEYLQALDEFERRDRAYQEAIASYQERIQNAADDDFRDEIIRLSTEVRSLQELLRSRDAEILRLEEQITTLESSEG